VKKKDALRDSTTKMEFAKIAVNIIHQIVVNVFMKSKETAHLNLLSA
jgi:hypothetical protein